MTPAEIQSFVDSHYWKPTSSSRYRSHPHEYTLRERCRDDAEFWRFVMFIRENGFQKKFFSKTFTYFKHGDFFYWTMGCSFDVTKLINRCREV
jgi:hypothetical protein